MKTLTLAATAGLAAAALIAACAPEGRSASGKEVYLSLCADCHGPDGKGDGPTRAGQPAAPADLTGIAARNGGVFPRNQTMGRIYGYTMGKSEDHMPAFGDLLEGESIPYDAGDGLQTPTPWRLVALIEYLETIQQ